VIEQQAPVGASPTFETERLSLRPVTLDDVDALVALDADPAVMRYITGGRPTPRTEVVETTRASLDHLWLAVVASTGEQIGWFSLRPSDAGGRERELGYRLRRSAWGQGYATEGARALVGRAFTDFGARRVWAQTMAANTASRRVMERCGLRYVRTFHLDWPDHIEGGELGDVEYELSEQGWSEGDR
jgi:RimJ/RimL family protein N-acetyltransferase